MSPKKVNLNVLQKGKHSLKYEYRNAISMIIINLDENTLNNRRNTTKYTRIRPKTYFLLRCRISWQNKLVVLHSKVLCL